MQNATTTVPSSSASRFSFNFRNWFPCTRRAPVSQRPETLDLADLEDPLIDTYDENQLEDDVSVAQRQRNELAAAVRRSLANQNNTSCCEKSRAYFQKNWWLVIPVLGVGTSYIFQNREGTKEFDTKYWYVVGLVALSSLISFLINGGLYEIVFKKMPKLRTGLVEYMNSWGIYNPVGVGAGIFFLTTACLLSALPLLAATLTGAKILGMEREGVIFGWFMLLARTVAVLEGFVDRQKTLTLLKNKMKHASPLGKRWIKTLLIESTISAALYVLTQRLSISLALGSHEVMPASIADFVQGMPLWAQFLTQAVPTASNFSFYFVWITLGQVSLFEPIWDPEQRNYKGRRITAGAMSALSIAPAAGPLNSSSGKPHSPHPHGNNQVSMAVQNAIIQTALMHYASSHPATDWVPAGTELPFERAPDYLFGMGIFVMLQAFFMNYRSLLQNFGVYPDAQEAAEKIKRRHERFEEAGDATTDGGRTPNAMDGRVRPVTPTFGADGTRVYQVGELGGEEIALDMSVDNADTVTVVNPLPAILPEPGAAAAPTNINSPALTPTTPIAAVATQSYGTYEPPVVKPKSLADSGELNKGDFSSASASMGPRPGEGTPPNSPFHPQLQL